MSYLIVNFFGGCISAIVVILQIIHYEKDNHSLNFLEWFGVISWYYVFVFIGSIIMYTSN